MTMMWPLPAQGKGLEVAARLAELTGLVEAAARDGLPAHALERSLWHPLLRLGHDLQAASFALAGDGGCGETLKLADGRVVKRLPEPHRRPYRSIFGDFTLERVVYGTREGQRIEAVPPDARLGLPEDRCSYPPQNWDQALVVENPHGQVDAVLERIPGLQQPVASLETMTRTRAGAVASHEATRPPAAPATGAQIVVLGADGKGVPLRKPADAPAIAAHDRARGPKPDRKKMAVPGAAYPIDLRVRTPLAVAEAPFRDPVAAPERNGPRRPVPRQKRVGAVSPVAAAVAAALAPPRPAEVVFPWLAAGARRRDPGHQHPRVLPMDGQPSLWEAAAATPGDAPRVEILDLLHATGYLWEAVHLFHAPGSEMALQWVRLLVLGLSSGMGTGVVRRPQTLGRAGRAARRPSHPPGADPQPLRPPPRPHSLRPVSGRRLPDRFGRDRRGLPPRRRGPDGTGGNALDPAGRPSAVAPALRGPQRRMGAVHQPSRPKRNGAPLCQHPDPAPLHPAPPRRLNQGALDWLRPS
jgi:hypothetical protein